MCEISNHMVAGGLRITLKRADGVAQLERVLRGPHGAEAGVQEQLNDGLDSQAGDLAPLQPERGRRERVRGVGGV
jgi:hypothetical protein